MIKILKTIFAALLLFTLPAVPFASAEEEGLSKSEIEDIVRDYILENPEIIAQAVMILQEREETRKRSKAQAALTKNHDLLYNDNQSIVIGNPDGDVTLIEFYDYRCPYCRQSHPYILQLIEEDKNVRVVMKQFPVKDRPGEVAVSLFSARMALAANKQGLFLEFHDAMFKAEPPLTKSMVYSIAKDIGLDMARLEEDMKSPEFTAHIRQTMTVANEIGATGTPTFVIGGYVIPSLLELDVLHQAVDMTRKAQLAAAAENTGD